MKYYVVDEKPDTIYAGEISKADPDKKVYELLCCRPVW